MLSQVTPNDDLDLQILWLDVLEKKGASFSSRDLADAFYQYCPYAPGEYAVFRKNYERGIFPPYSGSFNNPYYLQGMGCPIRSEIWACISPGDPRMAARLAGMDGILDHAGESVWAEQFLAALEALTFLEDDFRSCHDKAMSFVPEDSQLRRLIEDVDHWCKRDGDWKVTRQRIINNYGHPDCTNLFQNMGFALLALHYGANDLIATTMLALNCGFDTDCTCATAGAILGLLQGGVQLTGRYGIGDQEYALGVDITRRSSLISDLAEDTCRMGVLFQNINSALRIQDAPNVAPLTDNTPHLLELTVSYDGLPAIAPGDMRKVYIKVVNKGQDTQEVNLTVQGPDGWLLEPSSTTFVLTPGEVRLVRMDICIPENITCLPETNLFQLRADCGENQQPVETLFGLAGAAVWLMAGPFWENNVTVPDPGPENPYWPCVTAGCADEAETLDRVRDFHLSAFASIDKEYIPIADLTRFLVDRYEETPSLAPVYTCQDKIALRPLTGWQGPCVLYLARCLVSPEERTVFVHVGHSAPYRLYLNGDLISTRDSHVWWTNENVHIAGVRLKKGENILVAKLARFGEDASFSVVFSKAGTCMAQYGDFASVVPNSGRD
jgi:hypothetical protein